MNLLIIHIVVPLFIGFLSAFFALLTVSPQKFQFQVHVHQDVVDEGH